MEYSEFNLAFLVCASHNQVLAEITHVTGNNNK